MKNWKRIITLIVALAMALALSTPGFAAGAGYSDVSPDAWYARAVDFVTQHGLMNGVGNGRFDPSGSTSRAMLVTTLWRIEGEPVVNYLTQFSDVPGGTWYTVNNGNYSDDPDFRPYLTFYPVPKGMAIKGAALICPGGAFMFRSDGPEGVSVAQALSQRGYQSFVVDYRLRPYTQQEGALDLARAVRFVRAHAEEYGIDEQDIAVMGFSAGGILAGEMLLHWDGTVSPDTLDPGYTPDELERVSAGAAEQAGVRVERLQLDDMPHGFGARGGWIPAYDEFLTEIFQNN